MKLLSAHKHKNTLIYSSSDGQSTSSVQTLGALGEVSP